MHVPVLEHARTGLVQRFKSLAHFGFLSSEESAPRCRRESHAYTDPATGAIDQWRGVRTCAEAESQAGRRIAAGAVTIVSASPAIECTGTAVRAAVVLTTLVFVTTIDDPASPSSGVLMP